MKKSPLRESSVNQCADSHYIRWWRAIILARRAYCTVHTLHLEASLCCQGLVVPHARVRRFSAGDSLTSSFNTTSSSTVCVLQKRLLQACAKQPVVSGVIEWTRPLKIPRTSTRYIVLHTHTHTKGEQAPYISTNPASNALSFASRAEVAPTVNNATTTPRVPSHVSI